MANLIPRTDTAGGGAGIVPFGWLLGANTTGLTYTVLAPSIVGGFPSFNFSVSGTATATGSIFILLTPSSYNIPGSAYWFDNQLEHSVVNGSAVDRISMLIDIRPFSQRERK